jgi:hypothetical protein
LFSPTDRWRATATLLLLACIACSDRAPRGFQHYRLGAKRSDIGASMAQARQLGQFEQLAYRFITEESSGAEVTRWIDRRRVASGDSVTVIVTFFRERVSRVDVIYPPAVVMTEQCLVCQALRSEYGAPSSVDSTLFPSVTRWNRWKCCELRLSNAGLAVVTTYIDRRGMQQRRDGAKANAESAGRLLLQ